MKLRENSPARAYIRAAYQKNHILFGLLVLLALIESALVSLLAVLLQMVIDTATGAGRYTVLQLLCLTLGAMLVFCAIKLCLRECSTRFYQRASLQYRNALCNRLMEKNISAFSSEQTGTYIAMLTTDAETVDDKYFRSTVSIVTSTVYITLGLSLMFFYNWKLALVAVLLSSVPILVSVVFGGTMTKLQKKISERNAGLVSTVKDLLSGFAVIKSFQAEKQTLGLYQKQSGRLEQAKYRTNRMGQLIETISSMAALTMQMGVFLTGAYFASRGYMTAGVIVAFVQLSGVVVSPLQTLPRVLSERKAAKGLITKADRLLSGNTRAQNGKRAAELGEGITCQGLRFGYTPQSDILKGVDTHFSPPKSYAIVGASGSGKSTLLNLLLGSYDTYSGSVRIGSQEIRDVSTDSLYALVSIISQNVFVFDATIEENITMFKPFPDAAIQDAVRRAGLTELLKRKGRDYRCGENGCNLSGGERQRISIARCLLKNTQVLLMDEATAALDAQTAASVTNAILDIEGLMRIIVTHKLEQTVLRRFDEILVMRGGEIVERGKFDELIAEKGYFFALYNVSREEA